MIETIGGNGALMSHTPTRVCFPRASSARHSPYDNFAKAFLFLFLFLIKVQRQSTGGATGGVFAGEKSDTYERNENESVTVAFIVIND